MWIRTALAVLAGVLFLVLLTARASMDYDEAPEIAAEQHVRTEHKVRTEHRVRAERRGDGHVMLDERFSVEDGARLRIAVGDADVVVRHGPAGEVHMQIIAEAEDRDAARDYFERQHFSAGSEDGGVFLTDAPEKHGARFYFRDRRHPSLRVEVTAPERMDADLRTSDGDLHVERLDGTVSLRTSDGDVFAEHLTGPALTLRTSDGDVRLEHAEAETVELQTSDGDLSAETIRAVRFSARTSDGDVHAARLVATDGAEVRTSDGDLRLGDVTAGRFSARTSDGDVVVDALRATHSRVHTSDGSLALRRVSGALEATGNDADIHVGLSDAAPAGDVSIRLSDGDIVIDAPADLTADLMLRGEDGVRVDRAYEFHGSVEEKRVEGRLGKGGARLEARTSSGSVVLRNH